MARLRFVGRTVVALVVALVALVVAGSVAQTAGAHRWWDTRQRAVANVEAATASTRAWVRCKPRGRSKPPVRLGTGPIIIGRSWHHFVCVMFQARPGSGDVGVKLRYHSGPPGDRGEFTDRRPVCKVARRHGGWPRGVLPRSTAVARGLCEDSSPPAASAR